MNFRQMILVAAATGMAMAVCASANAAVVDEITVTASGFDSLFALDFPTSPITSITTTFDITLPSLSGKYSKVPVSYLENYISVGSNNASTVNGSTVVNYNNGIVTFAIANATGIGQFTANISSGSQQLVSALYSIVGPSGLNTYSSTSGDVTVSTVPLPAALPMFGAALVGLGGLARRRSRKAG